MSDHRTHPRTALITGASTGIGEEYARQLAERGFALVLVARRAEALSALAAELSAQYGVVVEEIPADLTDPDSLAVVEERLRVGEGGELTPIDLLVNNAGQGHGGEFARQDPADVQSTIALNITALTKLAHAVLPVQIERSNATSGRRPLGGPNRSSAVEGRQLLGIINVASIAGLMPSSPGGAIYAATKAYVLSFSETVAVEASRNGVRVTAVVPGYVRTDMSRYAQEAGVPDIGFVAKDHVVSESLRAWAAGRSRVVPGPQYKVASGLLGVFPRGLFSAVADRFTR
ncbi:SDR family NAD(P)-dependent oxidoreductase [Nocardiopsis ansamitocini]|uniref:Short chain dehydrogenase/reductase n=1 Tax=Nocardiopsis ansamitocini TaxID=1670832 RepID=A0A9W6UI13_9ACTN|nr:SDR family NAD(P)-dependent oxidoreductase [Nocardiopsis ansamitocini]GLU47252.1 putative short chain dehydrogenase/reductase [Nocardiopsis ansamitocini]